MMNPNILFILADDMGAWAMHPSGNDDVITPNLDKLAKEGTRFDNFFCVSPVCSPARASIFTGTIPSAHGVHDWLRSGNLAKKDIPDNIKDHIYYADEDEAIAYLDGISCYTDLLSENGYNCALVGKWHLGDSLHMQHGFSHWYTIGRGGCRYYSPDIVENGKLHIDNQYITDLITDHAISYLKDYDDEKPFYLSVHYTAPHSPWDEEEHPKDIYDLYRDCKFESTPDLPLHPNQVHSAPCGVGKERKRLLRGYYTAITAMDRGIGKILEALEKKGILNETIVIFTSDNGMNMGHHGIWGKGNGTFPLNMYDTSVKVPMIIRYPEHGKKGDIVHEMLSHYDLYPTLLDITGINKPENAKALPGKSFFDILSGKVDEEERSVVVFDEYGPTRMIRTEKYKLIYRYPYGPHELYDLTDDPDEKINLYDSKELENVRFHLLSQLQDWFYKYVLYYNDGVREGTTGFGQLGRCGLNSKGRKTYHNIVKVDYV